MPASQTVCQNGLVDQLTAPLQTIDGSTFPTVFEDGVERDQPDIPLFYQWQVSSSPTGPFMDIDDALARLPDYSPPPTAVDVYYRRLTTTSDCCGGEIVSTSDVSSIIVGPDEAPRVELPSLMITCPGESFTFEPEVTGGTTPFTYLWSTGETTPTIAAVINGTSLFGVTVTDVNNCVQVSQAPVQVYAADAGPDKSICAGAPVRLGGRPLPGVQVVPEGSPMAGAYSIAYTWTPAAGLSCTDCPRPTATPGSEETYTLTVTLYQPDGTTSCQTTDDVTVAVVAAPPTPNFAGEDMVICNGEEAMLGTPVDATIFNPASGTATSGGAVNVAQLNDGDFFNGIRTNDGTTQNIVLDMGSVVTLNQITLAVQNSTSFFERTDTDMRIEVSTDGTNYTTLFTDVLPSTAAGTPVSNSALTTLVFAQQDIRFFRFVPESNSRDASLSEFQPGFGFTYVWAPGEFLRTSGGSMATFDPGFVLDNERLLLEPNPRTYTLSAEFNGCVFVDEVEVAVIEARARDTVKGPTLVGLPDRTPGIDESYTWTRLDAISTGSSMFLGAMDEPQVPVSASFGGPTSYRLETEFTLSASTAVCVDTVVVTFCGCNIVFDVENGCADFDSYGEGTITASLNPADGLDRNDFDVSWSPMEGLDAYDQRVVTLLDNVTRTYTVTFTNRNDPTLVCTEDIPVNLPSYSRPTFNVTDSVPICDNQSVNIGDPNNNPGLEYNWSPTAGLDDPMISFPLATVSMTTDFVGTVVDPSTGCEATDTVTVQVLGFADGGPDIFVCDNGVVELGTPGQSGFTYSWAPDEGAGGDYRNGTGSTSAQPEVFVAASQQFILTTTETSSGCVRMDTVDVFVNPLPPPFTLTSTTFCPSDAPGTLTLGFDNLDAATGTNEVPMDNGTFTYAWSPVNFLVDPTVRNPTFATLPQVETTFTLMLDAGGGCMFEGQVTVSPEVTAPVTSGNQTICVDEETMIGSADNLTGGGITYNWVADGSNPAGATLVTATAPNPAFSSTEPGTFIYTVTRTENGCSVSATVTIRVQGVTIDPIAGGSVCTGESFQVVNTPQPGLIYTWSPTEGVSDPTIANPLITPPQSTTYTLTVINSNGCTDEEQVAISVSSFPAPEITLMDEIICDPADRMFNLMPTVTPPSGDYVYSWTPTTFITGDPTTPSPAVSLPNIPDQYTFNLEVTNQTSGCSAERTVTFDYLNDECMFDLALTKNLATGQPANVRAGDDVVFTINVVNQGTIEATDIEVTDYLPTGTTLAAAGTTPSGMLTTTQGSMANFTNNGDGTFAIAALSAGDTVSFDLALTIDASAAGGVFTNNAEITNALGGLDEDSPLSDVIGLADDDSEIGSDNDIDDDSTGGTDNPDDQDDYDLAQFSICNESVTLAEPFTVCATQTIDLTTDVVITPDTTATFGATWTTSDGTGAFLDADGTVLAAPFRFGTAVSYMPSAADAQRGSVTLMLTTDDPEGPCEPVSASVVIEILKVDCGQFFWDGQ